MSDHDTWNMFLAHAAAGMCAYHGSYGLNNSPGDIADRARQIADALLAESKKRAPAIVAPAGMSSDPHAVFTNAAPFRGDPTPPQPDDDGLLLPCPFCGSADFVKVRDYPWDKEGESDMQWGFHVICDASGLDNRPRGCGSTSGWGETHFDAVVAWNTRIVSEAGVTK